MIPDRDWLALCICTETDRPHEMQYVAAVILNRVRAGKTWPSTIVRVVRQAKQFSAFNATTALADDACFAAVRARIPNERFAAALACADDMLSRPAHLWPLDPATFWYWSPCSMEPPGAVPIWAREDYAAFEVAGVDRWRFVFAMAVPRTHPLRGEGERFDMRPQP